MPAPPLPPDTPHRTLIVRLSAIGDVVHTLPVAAALADAGHEVAWAVQPAARPLIDRNPAVATTVPIPPHRPLSLRALLATRRQLRAVQANAALDLQGLWKSAAWARASGAGRTIGFGRAARREPSSAILLSELLPLPPGVRHVIDKNLALLSAIGLAAIGRRGFPLPSHERERKTIGRALGELGVERPVLLHPGGGWSSKLWPVEGYGELAARLAKRGIPSLVSWGPAERELGERVVASSGGAARLAPAASLLELAALAEASRAIVAADTGPLHLACAVGAPAVALFGPTDPARNGPWSSEDVVVSRRPPCFPCHRRDCPRHAGALAEISADEVERALLDRLARRDR